MIKQLHTFIAVCQYGSFANAGHHIGLTQSAVSAQIKQLEYELGYIIFDRSGQKAVLTTQGEQLLEKAKHILSQIDELKRKHHDAYLQEHLKIGAIASVQTGILPQVLAEFFRLAPQSHLTIKPATSMQLLSMLENKDIDVALMLKPPFNLPKQLYIQDICQQNYVLISPKHYIFSDIKTMLQNYPLIRYEALSLGGREINDFLEKLQIQPNEILLIDDIEAIIALIEQGVGMAILPNAGLWKMRQANVNIIPLDEDFYRTISIVMPYRHKQRPIIQLLLSCFNHSSKH